MAFEEQYKAYYDEILTGHSYVDTRLSIQTAVADFLAQTFFGKDFSRILYTNPEYAFRKRIEKLAKGIDGEEILISDLKLPFCSYHLSSAPEIIKTAAASEWAGYYDEHLDQNMHFISTKQNCTVQFWFNNSEDATVAFKIGQRESLAEYPIRYIQELFWRNTTIEYPIWITVKKVSAGQDAFNESVWLENNHLYPLRLDLEIEVADIHIHRGLNAVQLPFKWHSTGNPDTWENGEVSYYAQKCVLMWANRALDIDIQAPEVPTKEVEEIAHELLKTPDLTPADDFTLRQIQSVIPNGATAEIVEGYFKDSTKIAFNKLQYNEEKTTISENGEVTVWIDTVVKPATYSYWDYTEIYIPSRGKSFTMKNCKDKYVQIDGLHPNSTYTAYFIAHDIDGNYNTIPLEFTTPKWAKEILPDVSEKMEVTELTTTIEKTEPEGPTIIRGRGLIGLEL